MALMPGWLSSLFGGTVQTAVGEGSGITIANALEPEAQEIRNRAWPLHPNVPHTPPELAQMVVQGVIEAGEGKDEALLSGVSNPRFEKYVKVAGEPIAPDQALALWNRGEIKPEDVDRALLQSRLKPEWVETAKKLRKEVLSAEALAEMVIQGVVKESDGVELAKKVGVFEDEFKKMIAVAGNPPGNQDTLSMWNRGIIQEPDVNRALLQSRLKPEWIDAVKASRIQPQGLADAVRGVVKERLTPQQGEQIAAQHGIPADVFAHLVEIAGRPISITEALALYNRKHYTPADVRKVVAYSDVRTEYLDAILKLAVRYPSLFQVRQLVSTGVIPDDYAVQLLLEQGYPQRLAEAIVHAAHRVKTQPERDLTKAEVTGLYYGGGISRDDAHSILMTEGYDSSEADKILDLVEFRRIAKYIEAVITRVHNQFVGHKIGTDAVTTELDKVGVPTDQREQLLTLWTEERAANVKTLTPAQILSAYRRNKLSRDDTITRLVQDGYTAEDAALLLPD